MIKCIFRNLGWVNSPKRKTLVQLHFWHYSCLFLCFLLIFSQYNFTSLKEWEWCFPHDCKRKKLFPSLLMSIFTKLGVLFNFVSFLICPYNYAIMIYDFFSCQSSLQGTTPFKLLISKLHCNLSAQRSLNVTLQCESIKITATSNKRKWQNTQSTYKIISDIFLDSSGKDGTIVPKNTDSYSEAGYLLQMGDFYFGKDFEFLPQMYWIILDLIWREIEGKTGRNNINSPTE